MWMVRINAVLGSLVVTLGFWLIWEEFPLTFAVALALVAAGFLVWRGSTIAAIWAWVTLLLGLESLAWPIVTMVQARMALVEPTEQQMGRILTAVLFGLFSSIFWLTFSYGIYKRKVRGETQAVEAIGEGERARGGSQKKKDKK